MAIGSSAMCGTFKKEILAGIHRLTSSSRGDSSAISADTFKVAMFTNSASIDADTAQYTTSNEVSGTNYTAGGAVLSSVTIGLGDDGSSSYKIVSLGHLLVHHLKHIITVRFVLEKQLRIQELMQKDMKHGFGILCRNRLKRQRVKRVRISTEIFKRNM